MSQFHVESIEAKMLLYKLWYRCHVVQDERCLPWVPTAKPPPQHSRYPCSNSSTAMTTSRFNQVTVLRKTRRRNNNPSWLFCQMKRSRRTEPVSSLACLWQVVPGVKCDVHSSRSVKVSQVQVQLKSFSSLKLASPIPVPPRNPRIFSLRLSSPIIGSSRMSKSL